MIYIYKLYLAGNDAERPGSEAGAVGLDEVADVEGDEVRGDYGSGEESLSNAVARAVEMKIIVWYEYLLQVDLITRLEHHHNHHFIRRKSTA